MIFLLLFLKNINFIAVNFYKTKKYIYFAL